MNTAIESKAPKSSLEDFPLNTWERCREFLKGELDVSDFNTWINPLQAEEEGGNLILWAPNRFVCDWVHDRYMNQIKSFVKHLMNTDGASCDIILRIGSKDEAVAAKAPKFAAAAKQPITPSENIRSASIKTSNVSALHKEEPIPEHHSNLNPSFTFDNYVEGKSNQLGRAAALQVAENPGSSYNPFFMYGGAGLGKTHLMHAIGNKIVENDPNAKVIYLHSERFVADMVKALQRNAITEFKRYYRSVNALLIDDIQFFAKKDRSQEEFFHTFNALLDGQQQIIITSDRYPKEIEGVEERLKSRLGWGLTVAIDPPDLETRVAILMSKAEVSNVDLPHDVAFFIAKQVQSNVRDLEGALKRVVANSHFTGRPITAEFARESLQDLLTAQARMITIDNIQKTVAEYYKIKVSDLLSKRRTRVIARPRQMAMALAKELTNNSLPEIGDAFGGRDHTTVLHACRKISSELTKDLDLKEDWDNLLRILSC